MTSDWQMTCVHSLKWMYSPETCLCGLWQATACRNELTAEPSYVLEPNLLPSNWLLRTFKEQLAEMSSQTKHTERWCPQYMMECWISGKIEAVTDILWAWYVITASKWCTPQNETYLFGRPQATMNWKELDVQPRKSFLRTVSSDSLQTGAHVLTAWSSKSLFCRSCSATVCRYELTAEPS